MPPARDHGRVNDGVGSGQFGASFRLPRWPARPIYGP